MPRIKRIKSLTNTYHVMIRGVNKRKIFEDKQDREKFLQLLKYYQKKYEIEIYGYCLMDNHVHLLLKDNDNLNRFMQCIQAVYALYFNKKYKRIGHLFQDRYKSIPVENQKYMLECLRYIHQNPVKANITSVDNFNWSSYNEYINDGKIVNTKLILRIFSKNKEIAINEYKKYMKSINKKEDLKNIMIEDNFSDKEARKFMESFYNIKIEDIKKMNKIDRDDILFKIVSLNIFSIRQISRITEIDRNIIRRI